MNKIAWTTRDNSTWAMGDPVKQDFYQERIKKAKAFGIWHQYQHLPLHKVRTTSPNDFMKMIGGLYE